MYDQPIVERKDSSPLATSLLAISAVCLIVASVLLGIRLKELTLPGNTPTTSRSTERVITTAADKEPHAAVAELHTHPPRESTASGARPCGITGINFLNTE